MSETEPKNNWTVQDLYDVYNDGEKANGWFGRFFVNPEYQRSDAAWTEQQKQLLIDSVLRGYEIPPIYLHEMQERDNCYEIIDGQQRINALCKFMAGRPPKLRDLAPQLDTPWAGKSFLASASQKDDGLADDDKKRLERHPVRVIMMKGDPDRIRRQFIRLQGGSPLTEQDILDALPGGFRDTVLIIGGKKGKFSARHKQTKGKFPTELPGHSFVRRHLSQNGVSKGQVRRSVAQALMLFLARRKNPDIFHATNTSDIVRCYEHNISLSLDSRVIGSSTPKHCHHDFVGAQPDYKSDDTARFCEILDILETHLMGEKDVSKLENHDFIHLVRFADMLWDDCDEKWQTAIVPAYKQWQENLGKVKKMKISPPAGSPILSAWLYFQLKGATGKPKIRERHAIYAREMISLLGENLKPTDAGMSPGDSESLLEALYYRDDRICYECKKPVEEFADASAKQVAGHAKGKFMENWALVHSRPDCAYGGGGGN